MADQPDELTITFKRPIKNPAGDEITEVTLREPTAAEWKTWEKLNGVDADIAAVSKLSGQPKVVIEQMVASQLVEGARYIAGFIQAAQSMAPSE